MQRLISSLPQSAALILLSTVLACSDDTESDGNGSIKDRPSMPEKDASPDAAPPEESEGGLAAGADPEDALEAFWDAFHYQRYEQIDPVIGQLTAAAENAPGDARLPLMTALSHQWWTVEWGRNPMRDPREMGPRSGASIESLMRAQALAPDDLRIPCWLGVTLMNAGRATQDPAMVAQGEGILESGVQAFPEFNLFCKMLAYSEAPRESPDFAKSVDAVWQLLDTCWGEEVDRKNPDISEYLELETHTGPQRACWNPGDAAPHNLEGFLLFAGDVLTKSGELDAAQVLYQNIREVPQFGSWPFAERVEERLAGLDARAALYADGDASNDPKVGPPVDRCSSCHAKGPAAP